MFACVLTVALGIPAARRGVRNAMRDALSTEVARQIPAPAGGSVAPGEYTITEQSLQQSLSENVTSSNAQDTFVHITPTGIQLGVTSRGQDALYTGTPVAENGRLVMQNMDVNSRFLNFILPADDLAKIIENAVNNYLTQNHLRLEALQLADGAMTLRTVPA